MEVDLEGEREGTGVESGTIVDVVEDIEDCRSDRLSGFIFNLPASDLAAA